MRLLICSHLLRDVEETCEEVVILKEGRVVQYANLEDERRANRRFLEVEIHGDAAGFIDAVEGLGCECAPGAINRWKIVLAEPVEIRDIYEIAAKQETQIRRLNFRRDTLEDIFLKAMENKNGSL